MKNYKWPIDKEVRMQMALIHQINNDFKVNLDFDKREKLLKHSMIPDSYKASKEK